MDWKKIAPWNWFKDESSSVHPDRVPARLARDADPFAAFRSEMERLFDETFSSAFPARPGQLSAPMRPILDITEGKKAYTVRAELPGVELDDVAIQVDGQTLSIQAEKRHETDEEGEGFHHVERSYGAFQRVLSLPEDANGEGIDAKFKNGVLKIQIPKHAARAGSGHTIEIQGG